MNGLRYKDIQNKPDVVVAMTTLLPEEFMKLVVTFEKSFQSYMAQWCLNGQPRVGRSYLTYSNCPLPTSEDRLLFALSYMKNNPLQTTYGLLFGLTQPKTSQWVNVLLPALRLALAEMGFAPSRTLSELSEHLGVSLDLPADTFDIPVDEAEASPLFCHDGTERRIERPQNQAEQTACFSGKKKAHTLKNLLLVDASLLILFLSETFPGSVHDKHMADANPYPLPNNSRLLQDLGFLAFFLKGVESILPFKKPPKQPLSPDQLAFNQQLAACRVYIEHVNSSVKRCRIVKDICRLRLPGAKDTVMEIACALHNFRLAFFPWLPIPQSI